MVRTAGTEFRVVFFLSRWISDLNGTILSFCHFRLLVHSLSNNHANTIPSELRFARIVVKHHLHRFLCPSVDVRYRGEAFVSVFLIFAPLVKSSKSSQ